MITDTALQYEIDIVWTEDIVPLRYVRETTITWARHRQLPPRERRDGRLVGYSVLAHEAPNNGHAGTFTRRVFWVHDTDPAPDGGCPPEAVDPLTVAPGKRGEKIERCR